MADAGLVHAFGHASVRTERGFLITPTRPFLSEVRPADLIELPLEEQARSHEREPLEAPLHRAVYRARPEVNAICRVHGPAITVWSARGIPPLLHGFGSMVEPVAWWPELDLVVAPDVAGACAEALGAAPALILRGNGALTVGSRPDQAIARAWALEDRCRVALAAGEVRGISPAEARARARWVPEEEARLGAWLLRGPMRR